MKHITITLALCAAALLSACGKKEEASAPATPAAPAANAPETASPSTTAPTPAPTATSAPAENTVGKGVFTKVCSMCHAAGIGGAPKPGDKADWGPRIAQGKDVLYKHAMEGFTGSKGQMPPRGASPTLTDDEVKAAVDYMADQSR
jgi:cytochrome c5